MTQTLTGADIRGYYHTLGIHLPDWAHTEASVRCFADPDSHRRGDRNPSCSVNLQHGAWNCHTCGATGGAFDAATARGYTNNDAFDLMVRYGLAERGRARQRTPRPRTAPRRRAGARVQQSRSPAPRLAVTERQVATDHRQLMRRADVLESLEHARGWTCAAIDELELGLHHERVTIPVRDQDGQLVALLRYQPGAGAKIRAVAGSHRVLYPHPVAEPAQRLLLVEGEPDLIAARSHQLPAVAIPGVNGWQAQWASLFAGRDVFIALDCDAQGRASAHRIAGDLCRRHVRVELVDLDPGREDGYDLTDWLHEHPGHGRDLLADPPSIAAGTT